MMDARERWVEQIARHVSDAIVVLDERRIIRFANPPAARMAGLERAEDLVGASYPRILKNHRIRNEDGSEAAVSEFPSELALREGRETRGRVLAQIDPEGIHHWLSITAFPLHAPEQGGTYAAVIYRDITQHKSREDKLRFLVESSKVLSITTDLETPLKEKMHLLVPALADWATINIADEGGALARLAVEHHDRAKVPLVKRLATIAAEHPDPARRSIYRVARSGKPELYPHLTPADLASAQYSEEGRALVAQLQPCSTMIVPIVSGSATVGVLSVCYAKSSRRYGREDLEFMEEFARHLAVVIDNARLYKEIARRDSAKDRFLATLSHELRNPLAPIKSSLDLIRLENLGEAIGKELAIVEHQFDQMEKLLRDLLDVTRFTLGKFTLTRAPVDLAALVKRACGAHRRAMEERSISFLLEAPERPVWITADAVRIEQMLDNLLHNAEKFTSGTDSVTVTLRETAGSAVLSVADTGIGIGKSELNKIFDQYYQSARGETHRRSGLGMGLVLVKQIVELHGGSVFAKSAGEGQGASFTVSLPLAREPERKSIERLAPRPRTGRRILVIDDNKEAADSLVRLLSAVGYDAGAAYSGREGAQRCSGIPPDYILIDIGMPEMNGYDVARMLRGRHGREVRLIALSGYGFEADKRRAREAGFDEHLTKPIGLAELESTIAAQRPV